MIVVTTPTGAIGRQVVAGLLAADAPVRVIARDPDRLPADTRDRVEVVRGSHGDPAVVTEAFAGADAVFWVAPPSFQAESVAARYVGFTRPACQALVAQGVQRVVSVSALGRGTPVADRAGYVTASLAMDDLIADTGVHFRSLALPSFMDNVLHQVEPIRTQGVFSAAIPGDLKLPTCATRDIAAAGTRLLLDRSWTGRGSVPVLGPEDLSHEDMARIMSEVLHRPVRFRQTTLEALGEQMAASGASPAMVKGMLDMVWAKAHGLDSAEARTPESSSPTTFRQWCAEVLRPAVEG